MTDLEIDQCETLGEKIKGDWGEVLIRNGKNQEDRVIPGYFMIFFI